MEKNIEKVTFGRLPQIKLTRVAAYCRVSTGKDAMLHSLSEQISYYSQLIQLHEGWIYCGVYADEAVSGTKTERENFVRLINDCRAGKIDMIITKSISRFARNTVTLLETVRELKNSGVGVFFEEQQINTLTADGEFLMTILASYAQEEARSVSENVKWRIKRDFEQGVLPMCVKYIYGYKRTEDGNLVINPNEMETVRMIYHLFLSGFGIVKIARLLDEAEKPCPMAERWSEHTVRYILSNEKYIGDLRLQKSFSTDFLTRKRKLNHGEKTQYYVQDNHEPIVLRTDYEKVQQELELRKAQYCGKTKCGQYVFTHKIRCGIGGKYYKRKISKGKVYWMCSTFDRFGKKECASKQIPEIILENITATVQDNPKYNKSDIDEITALPDNRLRFVFQDGRTEERVWENRSRRDSWTPEMKEQAKQREVERRKEYGKNNNSYTCDN